MKCYTNWSLHNRLSVVTMTYHIKKTRPPFLRFRQTDKHKSVEKGYHRSYYTGHVKKTGEILKSSTVTIWVVSYRLILDDNLKFYGWSYKMLTYIFISLPSL